MKLCPLADQIILDIITKVQKALYVDGEFNEKLRDVAIDKYDWKNISERLASDLHQLHSYQNLKTLPF